jgi:hypothetical protein
VPWAGDAVRSIPGPVRHGAAVALAAGGVVSVLGAAAPLAGPLAGIPGVADVSAAAAAFGAEPGASGGDTVATGGDTAATGSGSIGLGQVTGLPTGAAAAPVAPPPAVSLTILSEAARTAGERAVAEQQRGEEEARAAQQRAEAALAGQTLRAGSGSTSCGMSTASLGAVKPWVSEAAEFLGCQYGQPQVLGVGSRGNASDHPSGLAADFMTSDQATGDSIAACALENMDALGVSYVIWDQQINTGSGWKPMEDRGGPTANHEDHVHISFQESTGSGNAVAC